MIDYVAYICSNFFLNFSYTPYPKLLLFSMTKDTASQKPICHRNNNAPRLCLNIYIMYSMQCSKNTGDPKFSEAKFSYRFLLFPYHFI